MRPTYLPLLQSLFLLCAIPLYGQFAHHTLTEPNADNSLWAARYIDYNADGLTDVLFVNDRGELKWMAQSAPGIYDTPEVLATNLSGNNWLLTYAAETDPYPELVYIKRNGPNQIWARANINGTPNPELVVSNSLAARLYDTPDFNGDGLPDLAIMTVLEQGQELRWVQNEVLGYVTEHFLAEGGSFTTQPAFGDVDGDGAVDVAYGFYQEDRLYWSKNSNNGEFGNAVTQLPFPDSLQMRQIFLADLDGDGDDDMVVTTNFTARTLVYTFDSNSGQYNPPTLLEAGGLDTYSLLLAPVDRDGDNDLDLLVDDTQAVRWLDNNGNGTFSPAATTLPRSLRNAILMAADVNDDRQLDLSIIQYGAISHYLGNDFEDAPLFYPPNPSLTDLALADLNGDALPDLITHSNTTTSLEWQANQGNGSFGASVRLLSSGSNTYFQVVDIDGDGDQDIVYSRFSAGEIGVLLNDGQANFSPPQVLVTNIADGSGLLLADVDGDGDQDILTNALPEGQPAVLPQLPDESFGPAQAHPAWPGGNTLFVDLDGDGDTDYLDGTFLSLWWHENNGTPGMGPRNPLSPPLNRALANLAVGDLNGDSRLDILFSSDSIPQWIPNEVGVSLGTTQIISYMTGGPAKLAAADFDLDGDVDVFFAAEANDISGFPAVEWNSNTGNGRMFESFSIRDNASHDKVISGDVDNDGYLDVFYYHGSEVGWYENLFEPTFIHGTCFWDENENGIFDAGERPIRNITLTLSPEVGFTYTTQAGDFRFYAPPGDYTLGFEPNDCWMLTTDSLTYQVNLTIDGTSDYLFGFKSVDTVPNWTATLVAGLQRCDQVATIWGRATNSGCGLANGLYTMVLPPEVSIVAATPAPTSTVGNRLSWAFADLEPGQQAFFSVGVQVPGAEQLGQLLTYEAITFQTVNNDLVPVDTLRVMEEIRCAYDPNDKLVDIEEIPSSYHPDDYPLRYTIRFQNTGNDTAFRVEIRDTLSDMLDWSTFKPLGASHPYRTYFQADTGVLSFLFDPIVLPDSTTNLPASQGYVQFQIQPLPNLDANSRIANRGSIYFDRNPPIITNTITTVVQDPTAATEPTDSKQKLLAFPNPTSHSTVVEWMQGTAKSGTEIFLYDAWQRPVRHQYVRTGTRRLEVDLAHLPLGCYTLVVRSPDQHYRPLRILKIK